MHKSFLVLPLLALTACATPRAQCQNDATRNLAINTQLIAQSQATLNRGFAVKKQSRDITLPSRCRGRTQSGESVVTRCNRVLTRTRNVAVAVNLDAERAKLQSLVADRTRLQAQTAAQLAQCRAMFPAEP